MIVTLTPNPSIDRAVLIDALRRGEVHRASSSRIDPGGYPRPYVRGARYELPWNGRPVRRAKRHWIEILGASWRLGR